MMDKKTIITISRQYGSGGRYVGRLLADKLGIPFYDRELVSMTAEESGMHEDILAKADESTTDSFLYSLCASIYQGGSVNNLPINDRVFLIQSKIIRNLAKEGSCVIVGRCADYLLRKDPDVINVFIHSSMPDRINRCVTYYGLQEEKAANIILKTDKQRAAYYNYYTGSKWGVAQNYHLSINSDAVGIENAADCIAYFADKKK